MIIEARQEFETCDGLTRTTLYVDEKPVYASLSAADEDPPNIYVQLGYYGRNARYKAVDGEGHPICQ